MYETSVVVEEATGVKVTKTNDTKIIKKDKIIQEIYEKIVE